MSKFAEQTAVSVAKSRSDIEGALERYGATGFMYGQQGDTAMISFEMRDRRIRLVLDYPKLQAFMRTKTGQQRTATQAKQAYDQEIKRLWRGFHLIVKAKLEAIDAGITTLEDEFLASTVMPNNQTVGEWMEPQLEEVYRTGKMPPMIPGLVTGRQKRLESPDIIEGQVL